MTSALESALLAAIHAAGIAEPVREYVIAETGRQFRYDFAWPSSSLCLEVQGGIWKSRRGGKSRHTTGAGYSEDCVKLALAQLAGWVCLWVTSEQIADGRAVAWIKRGLEL